MTQRIIHLHPLAPAKPDPAQACNGCGVCCAAEPCPLGMWLSRRRSGACVALSWNATQQRYLCGALSEPKRWLPWLPRRWAAALTRRWIAAAKGCDSDLMVDPAP